MILDCYNYMNLLVCDTPQFTDLQIPNAVTLLQACRNPAI